jgi:hypothetical protein
MKRFSIMSAATIAGVAMLAVLASPAVAMKPDRFRPGLAPDLVVEGVCDFPVLLHDVQNKLVITDFFDKDGNLVRESGTGKIFEEVSRLDANGEAVTTLFKNISGPGTFTFDDEGFTLVARGPWVFFFQPGEVSNLPDGLIWFTTGRWVWRFEDATEMWTLVSARGGHSDVCALLD